MIPRSQRERRIAYLRFRLRLEAARSRFNAWGQEVKLDELLACALMGAILGAMLASGF